jgi:hypothetical protein
VKALMGPIHQHFVKMETLQSFKIHRARAKERMSFLVDRLSQERLKSIRQVTAKNAVTGNANFKFKT